MEEIYLSKNSVDPEKEIFKDSDQFNKSSVFLHQVRDLDSFDSKSVTKNDIIISSVDLDEEIDEDERKF